MNCKRLTEALLDYVDNSLDASTRAAVDSHLSQCVPCKIFFSTYKKTTALCRATLQVVVPKEQAEKAVAFLRKHLK